MPSLSFNSFSHHQQLHSHLHTSNSTTPTELLLIQSFKMYTSTIALALAPLLYLARADISLDRDDIPRECDTICDPIVQLTRTCDTDLRGDRDREEDRLEAQCVCTNDSFNVSRVAALCAGCIHQNAQNNRDDDDDDDDIRDDTEGKFS